MSADFSALANRLPGWALQVVTAAQGAMVPVLQGVAPVGKTGDTKRGVQRGPITGGTKAIAWLENTVPQAAYTNDGTDAHVISPTRAHGILANRDTGFIVRGPVTHPGSKKHVGWWDRAVQTRGPGELQRAAESTPF